MDMTSSPTDMDRVYEHKNYIVDNFVRMPLDDQRRILRDNIVANKLASVALQDNGNELVVKIEAITDPDIVKNMYLAVSSIINRL